MHDIMWRWDEYVLLYLLLREGKSWIALVKLLDQRDLWLDQLEKIRKEDQRKYYRLKYYLFECSNTLVPFAGLR
jgi:hypothetical protein